MWSGHWTCVSCGGQRDSPEGRLAEKCQPALGRGGGGGDSDGAGWGGDSFSQA